MSVNSKMTALADEIRELSGTTTSKSIDAMTSDVDAANTEITEQTELIAQITTALEGKASGGSGGNGNVDICTVTIDNEIYYCDWELFYSCLIDGKVELVATNLGYESKILENVIKNSYITVKIEANDGSISDSTFSGGVSVVKTFAPSGTGYLGESMSVWQVTSDGTVAIGS